MTSVKISVVTATYNSSNTILSTLKSLKKQTYADFEHVIVDGASTDSTLEVVRNFGIANQVIYSEKDEGIYDALNKGIGLASGDVIGFLHSDDFFPSDDILESIANVFNDSSVDLCFGDLAYVHRSDIDRIVRRWKASPYKRYNLFLGWMPPHPTIYVRRDLLNKYLFNLRYKISSDYDQILRLLSEEKANSHYIPRELVHMRLGGASNKNIFNVLKKSREDLQILKARRIGGIFTLLLKNIRKVPQFWNR